MGRRDPGERRSASAGATGYDPLGGRMPTAALRASMARSADGSLRGRRTGRWPLSRLAGTRAGALAALVYAASESTAPHPRAELDGSSQEARVRKEKTRVIEWPRPRQWLSYII